jgi:hypothetical protein
MCTSTYYNMTVAGNTLWTCTTCSGHEAQGYASMFGAGGSQKFPYGYIDPIPINISDINTQSGSFPFCSGSWVQPALTFSMLPVKIRLRTHTFPAIWIQTEKTLSELVPRPEQILCAPGPWLETAAPMQLRPLAWHGNQNFLCTKRGTLLY